MRWLLATVVAIFFATNILADSDLRSEFNIVQSFRYQDLELWKSQGLDFIRTHPRSYFSSSLLRSLYEEFGNDVSLHAFAREIVIMPKHRANRVALHYLAFYQAEGWRLLAEEIIKGQPSSPASSLALCRLATVDDSKWRGLATWVLDQPTHRAKKVAESRLSKESSCDGALFKLGHELDLFGHSSGAD